MALQANELRIGNWVKTNSDLTPYHKIESGADIDYAAVYNEPIPLTEEILKNVGFEKTYESSTEWILAPYYYYYDNSIWFGTSQIEILFLHDLQNLHYALHKDELNYTPN